MTLTVDQRRHLTAAIYGWMRDTDKGRTVIQEGTGVRRNAKVAVVEDLLQRGWIALGGDLRYRITEAGRAQAAPIAEPTTGGKP